MKYSTIVRYSVKSSGIKEQNIDIEMILAFRVEYYLLISIYWKGSC